MRSSALLIVTLLLGPVISSAAPQPNPSAAVTPADPGKACVEGCSGEQDHCATTEKMDEGADRDNLCATRFKICIERCDPHYLNYHKTIDEHPVRATSAGTPKLTATEQCSNSCGAKARTCSDAGNGSSLCDAGRAACLSRCDGAAH